MYADPIQPTIAVISASPTPAARASLLAGAAIASLSECGALVRRVELTRLPSAALFDGAPSDALARTIAAVRGADAAVLVAPDEGAACGGLLPALLRALPTGALGAKPVLPLLLGGAPGSLASYGARLVSALADAGAAPLSPRLFGADATWSALDPGGDIAAAIDEAVGGMIEALTRGAPTNNPRPGAFVGCA